MDNNIQSSVVSISVSGGGIPKLPVDEVFVTVSGLRGDGHNHAKHYSPLQAVCLQDLEILQDLTKEGFRLDAGTTGENLTVRHLMVNRLKVGTTLEFSGGVVLELTKERKPCYVLDAIDPQLKEVIAGRCGFYAKVVQEGFIQTGESIQIKERAIL